jgi:hypothetical protein
MIMKENYFLKRTVLVLMTLLVILPALTAQGRYRHVPRVKVDKIKVVENLVAPPQVKIEIEPEIILTEEVEAIALTEVATAISNDAVIVKEKCHSPIQFQSVKKNQKVNHDAFTEKLKQESKLFQVKDAKKTTLIGFLLWFVITVIIAVVILALAFILLGALAFSFWYILLIIGAAVLVIAIVLLILGLV